MVCCDTCPYSPTCEERDDFARDVLGLDEAELAELGADVSRETASEN